MANFQIDKFCYTKGNCEDEEYLYFTYKDVKAVSPYHNQIKIIDELSDEHIQIIRKEQAKYIDFAITSCSLTYVCDFNGDLDKLPEGIIGLRIGHYFNNPLNYLPFSLKELYFVENNIGGYFAGNRFNQPLDNLPNGLEKLQLSIAYSHSLGNLPITLKILDLAANTLAKDIDHLPDSIEILYLNNHKPPNKFPANLKKLVVSSENYKLYSEHYEKNIVSKNISFLIRDINYAH